jgi:protein-tyrosine-phosphatase
MEPDAPRVTFVCVRNAGRSQTSAAFARREADRRDLDVEVVTGGTDPADAG